MSSDLRYLVMIATACICSISDLPAQTTSDEEQIRRARIDSNAAIARHDVPAILSYIDEEFRNPMSTGANVDSRAAMGEAFAQRFAESPDLVFVRTTESVEVSAVRPVAAEIGHWVGTWTTPDGPVRTGGRYSASWRKSGDKWLIRAELYVPLFCEGTGCK